jgi:hypothetical protein
MTLAALELNDQSLLIQSEDQTRYYEPGYARLTSSGIVTGEEARAIAWREPQHSYNQYWCHLNQSPLANRHRFARHNGDIACAQLGSLWEKGGSPDSIIILAPGNFTRTQLSLLLGMVEALPASPSAVIDSALAACLDVEMDTVHIDMHMHESVVTVCRPQDGAVRIEGQEVFPGLGMGQILNSVARHISDLVIESYRFDPLHSSETEQAIYEEIPHWLTRLQWEQDISIKLESDKGELPCILRKDAVASLIGRRLTNVRTYLEEWRGSAICLSHPSGMLAGLMNEFAGARVARRTAGTRRALARSADIVNQADGLYRLRELGRSGAKREAGAVNGESLATHLLCGELALPLSSPVSIRLAENGPRLSSNVDKHAALTLVLRNHTLETLHGSADASLPRGCRPGDSILVGGHELKLIRVAD